MRFAAVISAALLAAPAQAEFQAPNGCQVFLTVQIRGRMVKNLVTCDNLPDGHTWSFVTFDKGAWSGTLTDAKTNWVKSVKSWGEAYDLRDGSVDPSNFTTLLDDGFDDFDFEVEYETGEIKRHMGFDRLTGKTVVIDGVPLMETEFNITTVLPDGTVEKRASGNQYVSPKYRKFFAGTWIQEGLPDGDNSPVTFAEPGERGFQSDDPKYDCDVEMS